MSPELAHALRDEVLDGLGARGAVRDELLRYGERLAGPADRPAPPLPLPDEAHVDDWQRYADAAAGGGAFATLAEHFVQLRFPIREGLSQDESYRAATRQGRFEYATAFEPGLVLERPDALALSVVPTLAGRVPVLVVGARRDFEALVRAFSGRNEPIDVPPAMGACLVTGLNNWSRVAAYREAWERAHPDADSAWPEEFKRFAARKALYQDRFIILSSGPYSNVPAEAAGEPESAWLERSLVIRREHECVHYFTQRVFGAMRNNLFDEVLADFVALARAYGRYRGDLARRFLGLENFPAYRAGARLETYRGSPPVSDEALVLLRALTARAIDGLERVAAARASRLSTVEGLAEIAFALCHLSLEELASPRAVERLDRYLEERRGTRGDAGHA